MQPLADFDGDPEPAEVMSAILSGYEQRFADTHLPELIAYREALLASWG